MIVFKLDVKFNHALKRTKVKHEWKKKQEGIL
jgi:hypothetical protein